MTSSGHDLGHVTSSEKKVPNILLYRDFFIDLMSSVLILITLRIDFVLFLKVRFWENFKTLKWRGTLTKNLPLDILDVSHRIPWKNKNAVYRLQISALVPEIFKFKTV